MTWYAHFKHEKWTYEIEKFQFKWWLCKNKINTLKYIFNFLSITKFQLLTVPLFLKYGDHYK